MIALDPEYKIMDGDIPNFNPKYSEQNNGQPDDLPKKSCYPFFSWQCITLQFETRNIDLVIKDEAEMDRFLKFLVRGIRTIDGRSGTADFLIQAATKAEIENTEKRMNKKIYRRRESYPLAEDEEYEDWLQLKLLTEEQRETIRQEREKEIYRQTDFKYMMMRVRSKISYHAFRKN